MRRNVLISIMFLVGFIAVFVLMDKTANYYNGILERSMAPHVNWEGWRIYDDRAIKDFEVQDDDN